MTGDQVGAFDQDAHVTISAAQAARILGVHPRSLARYPIPFTQYQEGGRRRYRLADVEAFRDRARITFRG